jgi:hypothetical protein
MVALERAPPAWPDSPSDFDHPPLDGPGRGPPRSASDSRFPLGLGALFGPFPTTIRPRTPGPREQRPPDLTANL